MAYIYGNWSNEICATVVGTTGTSSSSSRKSSSSSRKISSSSRKSSSSKKSSSSSSFPFCYSPPKCPTGYNYDILGYDNQGCPIYSQCYCVQCTGNISQTKTLSNSEFAGVYNLTSSNPPMYSQTTPQVGSSSSTNIVSLDNIAYNLFTQRWEIYRTKNGIKQIVNYYANGTASTCPCTNWIDASTGQPALLTFCDQKTSSSTSCEPCPDPDLTKPICPFGFEAKQNGFSLCGCLLWGPCVPLPQSSAQSSAQSSCSPTVLNCPQGTFKYCRPDVPAICGGDENCICLSGSSTSDSSISAIGCDEPDPCDPGINCTTKMRKITGYDSNACPIYSVECYKCQEVLPDPNDCPCGCCGDSSGGTGGQSSGVSGLAYRTMLSPTPSASSCPTPVKPTCAANCYPFLITLPNGCQEWKCSCKCVPPPPPPLSSTTSTSAGITSARKIKIYKQKYKIKR